ncbi:Cas10/Cmr2 second palm domain-containing protein [Mitsuokella sp. WILCCON 0060]|uniref:Cas10/Cmr2 second palm domain-containing protein n=1 Tax=Mitsuokella sp. WILCCON 0060 TaxID=3345341 RepID=UPI003F1ADC95
MEFRAILFDTRSIQKYIFSGNRLKTNIGASYLVDRVFDDALLPVIREVLGKDELDDVTWQKTAEPDWSVMTTKARVGYIGGGNALILFQPDMEEETLREIVSRFTKHLLAAYPGLHTGAAIGTLSLDASGNMSEPHNLTALVHQLKDNQNTIFPVVNVPYTGLTLSCEVNGEAATTYDRDEKRFFSAEVESKLLADRKSNDEEAPAERELLRKLKSVLPEEKAADFLKEFTFPMEIGELGQRETEDYIAIVHIDGNNMGAKFAGCNTLTKRKNMSLAIRRKTIQAFTELLEKVTAEYDTYSSYLTLHKKDGKGFLPVRPLVLGGDDMTFVCTAKVAIAYAKFIMESLQKKEIASCGGIAILPSSYPFFRGYEMAEQLCDAAKKSMRALKAKKDTESCWLDFALLHGEQAPTLEQIREQEYHGVLGNMHFGPYRVDADASQADSLAALLQGIAEMRDGRHKMPRNKIKELRRVLARGAHEQREFLVQFKYLQQSGEAMRLPQVAAWKPYEENLWEHGRTPYVDVIELLDYVPAAKEDE